MSSETLCLHNKVLNLLDGIYREYSLVKKIHVFMNRRCFDIVVKSMKKYRDFCFVSSVCNSPFGCRKIFAHIWNIDFHIDDRLRNSPIRVVYEYCNNDRGLKNYVEKIIETTVFLGKSTVNK